MFADAFSEIAQCDVMFIGSGSIRTTELGPIITLKDFRSCFPYDDSLNRFTIDGKKLKKIFEHFMRKENRNGEGDCYQINGSIKAVYNDAEIRLEKLEFKGKPVLDSQLYTICIQGYHMNNSAKLLNLTNEELVENENHKVISTSSREVLEEYLRDNQNKSRDVEGRLVYIQ